MILRLYSMWGTCVAEHARFLVFLSALLLLPSNSLCPWSWAACSQPHIACTQQWHRWSSIIATQPRDIFLLLWLRDTAQLTLPTKAFSCPWAGFACGEPIPGTCHWNMHGYCWPWTNTAPKSMQIVCVQMIKGWYLSPHPALVSYTSIKVAGEACRGKLLISSDCDPEKDATSEVSSGIATYRGWVSSVTA